MVRKTFVEVSIFSLLQYGIIKIKNENSNYSKKNGMG